MEGNIGMKQGLWKIFSMLGWMVIILALTSCSNGSPDRLWLRTESWSRALHLGKTSVVDPPAVAVNDQGEMFSVVFPPSERNEQGYRPRLISLGTDGEISGRYQFPFYVSNPKSPHLLYNQGSLQFFWIDSYELFMTEVSTEGELLGKITKLSGEQRVGSYDAVLLGEGELAIWYTGTRDKPGLYSLEFGENGTIRRLIDREGVRVSLVVDQQEGLHVSWANYPWGYGDLSWFYGRYPNGKFEQDRHQAIFTKGVSSAVRVEGPVLGLDQERVYLFWSDTITSGLDAGNRTTYFQVFPIGKADTATDPAQVYVPSTDKIEQTYQNPQGFQTGNRVSLDQAQYPATNALSDLTVNPSIFPETAVAFRSETEYMWRESKNQVNIAYFEEGKPTSYQPISFTSTVSYQPVLVNDQQGHLSLLWLEKRESGNDLYLATTDPAKMAYLNQVTTNDYLQLAAETGFGLLAGIVLSPFAAAVWGGLSLIALVINNIFKNFRREAIRNVGQVLSLIGALTIYWWLKFATLPGIDEGYVPFSAWIPRIPEVLETPLKIGVPVMIGLIGLVTAWSFTYRKSSRSPIYFWMIYSGTDAFLTTAVYGILIYGSF